MNDPDDRYEKTASIILARPGERLPGTPYQLGERIGGGGMGQVFRAEHVELGRAVAIKLLAPALAHDPKAMERLRREARAAARLGNPHIIDVYDLGITDDGRPFVVMKLIAGRDLKVLIDTEAPVAPERVVRLVRQIGDALRDAHAAGVVHRDLKPENVLIERRGDEERVTILDFGIAQSIQDTDTRLTRDGQMIGTPGYMAPEQALARPLDGRADQYALAVIVYEMLSGMSPFERLTALQLIAAQLTSAPRPLGEVVDASVPPEMVAVVMRGLARDPEARYPEVVDFVEALAAAQRGESAVAVAAPSARGGRRAAVLGALAVVMVAVVGGLLWAGISAGPGAEAGAGVVRIGVGSGAAGAGVAGDTAEAVGDPAGAAGERAGAADVAGERAGAAGVAGGQTGTDRAGTERAGPDRAGADVTGSDRAGSDPTGTERAVAEGAAERTAAERTAAERTAADRAADDRTAAAASAVDRAADRTAAAASAVDRSAADRTAAARTAAVDRTAAAANRAAADRAAVDRTAAAAAANRAAAVPTPEPTPAGPAAATTPTPEPTPPPVTPPPVTPPPVTPPPVAPPPAAPPELRFGALQVVGGASGGRIGDTVEGGYDAIRACVAQAPPIAAGKRATVRFVIDADGFFGSFEAEGDNTLAACGQRVLRRINRLARRPDTGDIRVALSMSMEAR